jgi:hypothetical protein
MGSRDVVSSLCIRVALSVYVWEREATARCKCADFIFISTCSWRCCPLWIADGAGACVANFFRVN